MLTDTVGGSYNSILGIYTVSGSDAEVTAALNALTFQPTAHEVTPGQSVTTNLSLTVNDGHGGSTFSSTSIVATAADDAPVITGNLPSVAVSDASSVQPFAAVQVTDVDVGKIETVTVALDQPGNGLLTDTVGGSYNSALGIYTVSGSDAEVTAALNALTFQPTAHEVTPGQSVTTNLSLTVNDGHGGSTFSSTSIVATAADDAPVITGNLPSVAVSDASSVQPFAAVQVIDVDVGKIETVTVALDQPGNGLLTDTVGGSYNSALGIYTVSGSDAEVTAALNALTFQPTAHEVTPGQSVTTNLSLTVNDGHGDSTFSSTSIVATAADDAPVITGNLPSVAVSDASSVQPFAAVQVIDVDVGKIETVTVALDQPGNGLLTDTVGGSYNSILGIYTVSGSDAEVTAALNALTFQPTAHEVTPGQGVTTNLSLTVNDGHGGSTFSSTSIVATAADDAPVITGNLPSVAVSDASSVQPFAAVQVTDVDVGKIETVTVALDQPGNGLLTDTVGGTYHPVLGIYTVSGSAAEITADLEALTFQPKAHEVTPGQSVTTDFTLTVNDGRGGSGVMSTSVVATATDDAPIITGGQTAETVPLGTALKPFSSVRIVDVDFGKVETATVSLSTLSGVVLTNLSSGSYDPSLGIYTVSGTASAVSKALQDLVLRPITHEVTAGTELQTTLTLTVSDGQGGSSTLNTTVVMASPEYNAKNLAMSMQGGAESLSLASPASNDNFSAKQSISVSLGSTGSPKMTPTGSEGLLTKSTDPQLLNVQDTNDPRGDTLELARADAGVSSTASVSGPDRVSNSSHPQQRVDRYVSTFHLPGLHQPAEHSIPVPSQEHIGALRDALLSGRTGLENTFTSGRAGIQCNSIPYPDPQPLSETQVHLRSLLVKTVWTPSSPAIPHSAEVLMEVTDHEGLQPHAGLHSEHSTFDPQHSIDHAHQQSWVGLHNHH